VQADCLLKLYMLVKSARTVSREFTGKNVSTLGLLRMVSWWCCDNTLLLCKTWLHAVCHQPVPQSRPSQTMGRRRKNGWRNV